MLMLTRSPPNPHMMRLKFTAQKLSNWKKTCSGLNKNSNILEKSSHKIFPSGIFHRGLGKGVLPALRVVADLCPALPGNTLHGGTKRMKPILLTLCQENTTGKQRTQPKKCSWRCSRLPSEHRMRHLVCGSYLTLPTTQEWTSPKDNEKLLPLLELCMATRKAATVSQQLLQQEGRRELIRGHN